MGLLGLCLLLAVNPERLAAQDVAWRLFPTSAEHGWLASSETAGSTRSVPTYRLLPEESREHQFWTPSADLATDARPSFAQGPQQPRLSLADLAGDAAPRPEQPEAAVPRWDFLERHRTLFSTIVPVLSIGSVTVNSLAGYNRHGFQIHKEGWFGRDTVNGGADKASHLADYYVVTHLLEDVYRSLGWSDRDAIIWGVSLAVATGLGNEVSDGFTRHGFSWEDLAMDAGGAALAGLVSATGTRDLFSIRTSHLPEDTYSHDVYSADLKLSGLGKRLGLNLGPLRWLLFSVTYGSKGYRVSPPTEKQRLVGFEIGLNFQQILFDVGVKRDTWWGYALHLVADNVRFPYTAFGMRLDLNTGKWHGPNSGNYD